MRLTHQTITRAIGGTAYVVTLRDPAGDGSLYSVGYENRDGAQRWLSKQRFVDVDQAQAGARTLAEFLGAAVRR